MKLREKVAFIKAFLQNPLAVGAIFPSSAAAAKEIIRGVRPTENAIVLELGCGTGSFTRAIEKILPSPSAYLGVEINKELYAGLREEFPNLNIVLGDAGKATEIHRKSGLGEVKYIISGLPFASLPETVSEPVLAEIDKFMRRDSCEFRMIQYATSLPFPAARKFRRMMNQKYGKARRGALVWRNLPPTYIFVWQT